jgi:hypothetical protein
MGTQFLKILCLFFLLFLTPVLFAAVIVDPPIQWLPKFVQNGSTGMNPDSVKGVVNIIKLIIQYTSVIAVIAVIYGWIQYILSFGADDKTKQAKWIIIYALVGVGISIAAYAMVAIVASISSYNFY